MWYVITITEDRKEKTVLGTRYRDVAEMTAATLPGENRLYFVPDNWNENDSLTLYSGEAIAKSA